MKNSKELLLTPSEAAELLSVSPTTIRLWARNGRLTSVKTPGGHRRFNKDEVMTLLTPSSADVDGMFTILVVEDDIKIAQFIQKGLKSSGFAVDHAATGTLGFQMAFETFTRDA